MENEGMGQFRSAQELYWREGEDLVFKQNTMGDGGFAIALLFTFITEVVLPSMIFLLLLYGFLRFLFRKKKTLIRLIILRGIITIIICLIGLILYARITDIYYRCQWEVLNMARPGPSEFCVTIIGSREETIKRIYGEK